MDITDAEWIHRLASHGAGMSNRANRGQRRQDEQGHNSYTVTSLSTHKASARRLLKLSREHWGIENRLHWVKDVTFDEDRCQVRSGSAPQVLSTIRNTVIGLLRIAGNSNVAAALRRNAARPDIPLRLVGATPIRQ